VQSHFGCINVSFLEILFVPWQCHEPHFKLILALRFKSGCALNRQFHKAEGLSVSAVCTNIPRNSLSGGGGGGASNTAFSEGRGNHKSGLKLVQSIGLKEPNARGYNWATLFLGDINTGAWPSRSEEESRYWDNKILSWVPRDSDPKKTPLARPSNSWKAKTRPLVRKGAPHQQTRNCLKHT
jgi:hypothetical protein